MKLRRLCSAGLLVVLAAALLAAPVSAGRAVTPVTFRVTAVLQDLPEFTQTGPNTHLGWVFSAEVVEYTLGFNGTMSWEGGGMWKSERPLPGWGAWNGKFRLENANGGWEGNIHTPPWTDPVKWPNTYHTRFHGKGYGAYEGTRVELAFMYTEDYLSWTFAGELIAGE